LAAIWPEFYLWDKMDQNNKKISFSQTKIVLTFFFLLSGTEHWCSFFTNADFKGQTFLVMGRFLLASDFCLLGA
jgi:hypothetical protein